MPQVKLILLLPPNDGGNGTRPSTDVAMTTFAYDVEIIHKATKELGLDAEEQRKALSSLVAVMERRFPQIMTVLLLEALLPLVQKRSFHHFRHQHHESIENAMDLSQSLVAKILQALVGHWPHGNIGAWIAAIRANLHADHQEKRARERQWLEKIETRWNTLRC